ncbi:unnamed protein product [Amoebophrya sp. A120]|nr:unnamed protein product [Amoebophrya sp. A120]|eukprot:GSA120T00008991001.1
MTAPNGTSTTTAAAAVPAQDENEQKFLDKFSRQNAAFGAETTLKMTKLKILVVGGGNGVGIETCKNLVLQGCGGLTIFDDSIVKPKDLGVNFFLQQEDIGKKKHDVIPPRLQELNPLCKIAGGLPDVTTLSEKAVLENKFSVMIITDSSFRFEELKSYNEFCRKNKISFLYARSNGVFATIFADHGDDHLVNDKNGENPLVRIIESIEKADQDPLVRFSVPEGQKPETFPENSYIELSSGDIVGLKGIEKHTEELKLPNGRVEKLVNCWKTTQKSGDPSNSLRLVGSTMEYEGEYVKGGTLTEKKVNEHVPSHPFSAKLANPGIPFMDMTGTDMLDFGSELQVHLGMATVLYSKPEEKYLLPEMPKEKIVEKAKQLLSGEGKKLDLDIEVNEDLVYEYVRQSNIELQPLSAFLGGVLGQEAVKITGKFTPIPGFLHFHAREALPDSEKKPTDLPKSQSEIDESRYGDLEALYGKQFIAKLQNLKLFMVGCGALGCELLKNFALNGICCPPDSSPTTSSSEVGKQEHQPKGKLTVTDADRIELSNLARQFLFREHNVGQPKSVAAGEMAKKMSRWQKKAGGKNELNIRSLEMFVGKSTEEEFDDKFWMDLDLVVNALDNMEARLYVDDQCCKYEKPLLESGTMGPSGNVDPVVPFITKTYRDGGQAAQGGGIPMCTLRNFPHLPDHCIEWARDLFEMVLVKTVKQLAKCIEDVDSFVEEANLEATTDVAQSLFEARILLSFVTAIESPSLKAAGQVAFDLFHLLFRDKIKDLVTAFPESHRMIDPETKADKGPFWTGHKRFPKIAAFDVENKTHCEFMIAATNLIAVTIGANPVKIDGDDSWVKEQRTKDWLKREVLGGGSGAASSPLKIPEYMSGGVKVDDDPNLADQQNTAKLSETEDKEGASSSGKAVLARVVAELKQKCKALGTTKSKSKIADALEEADFEKDDDFNFHISFITQAANLRADNYSITNSDFQKVKLIAGRIIPAIATTTAAVTGLVILELFKVLLKKPVTALRQRLVGLATNTYTSFEADEPKKLKSGESVEKPDPTSLPKDAFDEAGKIKEEFFIKEKYAAYPNPHSVWDKLTVPTGGAMKMKDFMSWLEDDHNLVMTNWAFIIGHKKGGDDGKEKIPVSTQVYPFAIALDPKLIPDLTLDQQTAMSNIMKSTTIPQNLKMKYMNEWRNCKATGKLPEPVNAELQINNDTPLEKVLRVMATKAEQAVKDGKIDAKLGATITHTQLDNAKFWLIPSEETPSCETNPTYVDGDDEAVDVKYLAAIKIPLVTEGAGSSGDMKVEDVEMA